MIATSAGLDVATFFRALYPEGSVCNVRVLGPADKPLRDHCKSYVAGGDDDAALGRFVAHHSELCVKHEAGVFIGVCPRFAQTVEPRGKKDGVSYDRAWQIRSATTLWADIDPGDGEPPLDYQAAKERWTAAKLPEPSCVVQSGNGVHLYWFLAAPYLIDDCGDPEPIYSRWEGTPGNRKKVNLIRANSELVKFFGARDEHRLFPALSGRAVALQDTLRGIARALGSDSVHDITRILRMPGTLNMKRPRAPRPCEIIDIDGDRRYSFDDFSEARAQARPKIDQKYLDQAKLPEPKSLTAVKRKKLAAYWEQMIAAAPGKRSEVEFVYLKEAIRQGCPKEECWSDVHREGGFNDPDKGRRYFELSWEKAEIEVREEIASALALAGISAAACAAAPIAVDPSTSRAATPPPGGEGEDDPHRLARVLQNTNFAGGPVRYWRENWYVWIDACWRQVPDSDMRAMINAGIKREFDRLWLFKKANVPEPGLVQKVTPALVTSVSQALVSDWFVPAEIDWNTWLPEPDRRIRNWVAMENGILQIDRMLDGAVEAVVPNAPDWWSPVKLPYAFDRNATCPQWGAFLRRNLEGDAERIAVLQEFLGYSLIPSTEFQKFLVIQGNGSNGKSVICAVAEALVGPKNTSHVPLEEFGGRFALGSMIGKLLNVVSEIGIIDRAIEAIMKKIVSGDPCNIDRKNRDAIEARLFSRLIFGTNSPPRFVDKSNGTRRRLILMPITVVIDENDPSRVFGMDSPQWWIDRGEMAGVFLWAMQGLERLLKNRRFTSSKVINAALAEYWLEMNPARQFFADSCAVGSDSRFVFSDELYEAYTSWCKSNGIFHVLSQPAFGKEVAAVFGDRRERESSASNGTKRRWLYRGLALADPPPDLQDDADDAF